MPQSLINMTAHPLNGSNLAKTSPRQPLLKEHVSQPQREAQIPEAWKAMLSPILVLRVGPSWLHDSATPAAEQRSAQP